MIGNKIRNQVTIPKWIKENNEFLKRCIKGLIDTDGCIYTCKRERQKYIKFTNFNISLLTDFQKISNQLGYNFVSANKRNVCLYRKEDVKKFLENIKPMKAIFGVIK
jgi:intein/homing endonuclease